MATNKGAIKAQARELTKETVTNLKAKAKSLGMKGYSQLNKADLVLEIASELVRQQLLKLEPAIAEVEPEPVPQAIAETEPIAVEVPESEPEAPKSTETTLDVQATSVQFRKLSVMLPTRQEYQDNVNSTLNEHRAITKPIDNAQIFGMSLARVLGKQAVQDLVNRLESLANNKRILGLGTTVSLLDICIVCLENLAIKDYLSAKELSEAVKAVGKDGIKFTRPASIRVRHTLAPMAVYLSKHFWLYFDHTLSLCKQWLKAKS